MYALIDSIYMTDQEKGWNVGISSSQVVQTEINQFLQLNYKFLLKIRSRNKARNEIQIKY
jgi:hypothetical protein